MHRRLTGLDVVVVGGGWAGVGAALAARMAGSEVTLLERTDMLLGTGLVGGIVANNGNYDAMAEHVVMGMGELWQVVDDSVRHRNLEFPGQRLANVYDVSRIEPAIKQLLENRGVSVQTCTRVTDVIRDGTALLGVVTVRGQTIAGRAFVDATGTAGPQPNCARHGRGCAMCVLRCETFGGRVSVSAKAGVAEKALTRADGSQGVMSGSCELLLDSVAVEQRTALRERGVVSLPLPDGIGKRHVERNFGKKKACQQYTQRDYGTHLVVLDSGYAKALTTFFPLEELRQVPGLARARFQDPYAGGVGNSVRFLSMTPHSDALLVDGLANLFCAGEKVGPVVGHTPGLLTGTLAGHNAARAALGLPFLVVPPSLITGHLAGRTSIMMRGASISATITLSGGSYLEEVKGKGLVTGEAAVARERVRRVGLQGVYSSCLQ